MDPLTVIKALEGQRRLPVVVDGEELVLVPEEVEVRLHTAPGFAAEGLGGEFAILDTGLTPALEREGRARELVHHIQQLRKDEGLELADRIVLFVEGDAALEDVLRDHGDYLLRETLSVDLRRELPPSPAPREVRLDGMAARIALRKAP
jgi:isoleucyl-tRNA synthetase